MQWEPRKAQADGDGAPVIDPDELELLSEDVCDAPCSPDVTAPS